MQTYSALLILLYLCTQINFNRATSASEVLHLEVEEITDYAAAVELRGLKKSKDKLKSLRDSVPFPTLSIIAPSVYEKTLVFLLSPMVPKKMERLPQEAVVQRIRKNIVLTPKPKADEMDVTSDNGKLPPHKSKIALYEKFRCDSLKSIYSSNSRSVPDPILFEIDHSIILIIASEICRTSDEILSIRDFLLKKYKTFANPSLVNLINGNFFFQPLHSAIERSNIPFARLLIELAGVKNIDWLNRRHNPDALMNIISSSKTYKEVTSILKQLLLLKPDELPIIDVVVNFIKFTAHYIQFYHKCDPLVSLLSFLDDTGLQFLVNAPVVSYTRPNLASGPANAANSSISSSLFQYLFELYANDFGQKTSKKRHAYCLPILSLYPYLNIDARNSDGVSALASLVKPGFRGVNDPVINILLMLPSLPSVIHFRSSSTFIYSIVDTQFPRNTGNILFDRYSNPLFYANIPSRYSPLPNFSLLEYLNDNIKRYICENTTPLHQTCEFLQYRMKERLASELSGSNPVSSNDGSPMLRAKATAPGPFVETFPITKKSSKGFFSSIFSFGHSESLNGRTQELQKDVSSINDFEKNLTALESPSHSNGSLIRENRVVDENHLEACLGDDNCGNNAGVGDDVVLQSAFEADAFLDHEVLKTANETPFFEVTPCENDITPFTEEGKSKVRNSLTQEEIVSSDKGKVVTEEPEPDCYINTVLTLRRQDSHHSSSTADSIYLDSNLALPLSLYYTVSSLVESPLSQGVLQRISKVKGAVNCSSLWRAYGLINFLPEEFENCSKSELKAIKSRLQKKLIKENEYAPLYFFNILYGLDGYGRSFLNLSLYLRFKKATHFMRTQRIMNIIRDLRARYPKVKIEDINIDDPLAKEKRFILNHSSFYDVSSVPVKGVSYNDEIPTWPSSFSESSEIDDLFNTSAFIGPKVLNQVNKIFMTCEENELVTSAEGCTNVEEKLPNEVTNTSSLSFRRKKLPKSIEKDPHIETLTSNDHSEISMHSREIPLDPIYEPINLDLLIPPKMDSNFPMVEIASQESKIPTSLKENDDKIVDAYNENDYNFDDLDLFNCNNLHYAVLGHNARAFIMALFHMNKDNIRKMLSQFCIIEVNRGVFVRATPLQVLQLDRIIQETIIPTFVLDNEQGWVYYINKLNSLMEIFKESVKEEVELQQKFNILPPFDPEDYLYPQERDLENYEIQVPKFLLSAIF